MSVFRCLLVIVGCVAATSLFAESRRWTDASGKYHFRGTLLASNETSIVLERGDKKLISVDVDQLSKRDREHLQELEEKAEQNPQLQTWTTRRGYDFRAAVVEYGQRTVTIRSLRGKAFVNDKRFDRLPDVYRRIAVAIVSHFEGVELDAKSFEKWVDDLDGEKKTYQVDGVLMQLDSGDLYALPFFVFSDQDQELLKSDWDAWSKAEEDQSARDHYSLSMQARAASQQAERAQDRQLAKLQLQMQGYQAGLFDLWEVALIPPRNSGAAPLSVVVPARNSAQARSAALAKYPNYQAGATRRVPREY